ncbi:autotransporter outer membrane beta-barrel domain-containing protein [Flavobacterium hydrophilum]|uniref:tRNA modification GTPase n=1 Tax=Flavobacterium hydrophilum TaxID=2211445 RepID=A0A2V4BWH0_9FLAO|nr:autotransporter outer membrane beta-barrel domain-containing protein [Flavobacterium hydrophilum]PXY43369.1 tRNA modification GTPase [Flavobacterium hydrophilum]
MKKHVLFLTIAFVLSINSYSQIVFENGYFVTDNDKRTDCLIENIDWKNTPVEFKYKLSQGEDAVTENTSTVKEFAINGQSKFIRSVVKIDRSSKIIEYMSKEKNPVFNEEKLFLQVLIEGKAKLFLFDGAGVRRFFYKIDDSEIKQLVYKPYLAHEDSIAHNNYFREQLYIDLKCENIEQNEYEKLNYKKNDLTRFFLKYNKCNNSEVVDFENKEKKDLFNLTIRPRLNNSSLTIENSGSDFRDFDFGSNSYFTLGVEAEFILPFNKNRWAVIVEPTYQYFKAEKSKSNSNVVGGKILGKVDYKSIELPVGIRRYFFVNNAFKIFANTSLVLDFSSSSKINFTRNDGSELSSLDVSSALSLGLGIGCKFKDKYSVEMRYLTARGLLSDYSLWNSSYKTASLILGYSFF